MEGSVRRKTWTKAGDDGKPVEASRWFAIIEHGEVDRYDCESCGWRSWARVRRCGDCQGPVVKTLARRQESVKLPDKVKTRTAADKALRHELLAREETGSAKPDRITLVDWTREHVEGRVRLGKLKQSTAGIYRYWIDSYLTEYFDGYQLQAVNTYSPDSPSLDGFVDWLLAHERQPGPKTVRNIVFMVAGAFRAARKKGLIATNPALDIELPDLPQPGPKETLGPVQLGDFLERARIRWAPVTQLEWAPMYPLVRLVVLTGMSRSEVLGLTWPDIDFDHATVAIHNVVENIVGTGPVLRVDNPKVEARGRFIPIDAATVEALRSHRRGYDSGKEDRVADGTWQGNGVELVFCREDGTPLRPRWVTKKLQALQGEIGLPVVGVHGLRTSYATNAARAGLPVKTTSSGLGHSLVTTTLNTYTQVPTDDARAAMQAMVDLIEPKPPKRPWHGKKKG